ncbi:MFS transporter [Aliagarivorans taiwanensis]|uniref:MFS transporter n=1 Tax=Aliagarivorans taiwanensis TaxID=561966 RepID=UPI0003FFFEEB|nr:MFS transporter [Aliagarivorans taiwanensis]
MNRSRLSTVLIGSAQTLLWAALYYSFPALLADTHAHFDWSLPLITGAFTSFMLMMGLAAPFIGCLIDRGLGLAVLNASATLGGLCLLALGAVTHYWQYLALCLIAGLAAAGCLYEPCFSVLTRYRGAQARSVITSVTLMAGFAGTLSYPFCHYAVNKLGWTATVQVLGGFTLVVTVPLFYLGLRLLRQGSDMTRGRYAPSRSKTRLPVIDRRLFGLVAAAFSTVAVGHYLVISFFIPGMESSGINAGLAVQLMAMVGLMQVLGRVLMLFAGNRLSALQITMVSFACLFAASLLLVAQQQFWYLAFVFVALQGSAYGVTGILRPVLLRELFGKKGFGQISGMLSLPYMLCAAATPLLGAILWSVFGWPSISLVMVVAASCGVLAIAAVARRHQQTQVRATTSPKVAVGSHNQ